MQRRFAGLERLSGGKYGTDQKPVLSRSGGLFLVVPALWFSLGKQEELDHLHKGLRANANVFCEALVTSQMRTTMAMIQTILHLVTSVSSST